MATNPKARAEAPSASSRRRTQHFQARSPESRRATTHRFAQSRVGALSAQANTPRSWTLAGPPTRSASLLACTRICASCAEPQGRESVAKSLAFAHAASIAGAPPGARNATDGTRAPTDADDRFDDSRRLAGRSPATGSTRPDDSGRTPRLATMRSPRADPLRAGRTIGFADEPPCVIHEGPDVVKGRFRNFLAADALDGWGKR
jgi:hypothetical protein